MTYYIVQSILCLSCALRQTSVSVGALSLKLVPCQVMRSQSWVLFLPGIQCSLVLLSWSHPCITHDQTIVVVFTVLVTTRWKCVHNCNVIIKPLCCVTNVTTYFVKDSRQRTIYEYHRVEINMTQVASNSAVIITPLPSK